MRDYDLKEETSGLFHWCSPSLSCTYLVYKSAHLCGITVGSQPGRAGLSRPGRKRVKCSLFLQISRRKNKFRLGAALSFQAQLQPRGLLVAEGTAAAMQEMKCLVESGRCCAPTLPPFTALTRFPAPRLSWDWLHILLKAGAVELLTKPWSQQVTVSSSTPAVISAGSLLLSALSSAETPLPPCFLIN